MKIKYENGSPKKQLTFLDVEPGQLFRFAGGPVCLKLNDHPNGEAKLLNLTGMNPLPVNAVKLIRSSACGSSLYFPMSIAPYAVVTEILDITEIIVRRVE